MVPNAKLYFNDYNTEYPRKRQAMFNVVKALRAEGVPIDGVGFQGHLDTQYGFPDVQANLQRFADLGLEVAITEADVRTFVKQKPDGTYTNRPLNPGDAQKQVDYWVGMLEACLAVDACNSFTVWGVSDAYSWIPGVFTGEGAGLLFDMHSNPKPQYDALREVLRAAA